jgi:hypothetical protein
MVESLLVSCQLLCTSYSRPPLKEQIRAGTQQESCRIAAGVGTGSFYYNRILLSHRYAGGGTRRRGAQCRDIEQA